ncbi:MAG: hypothetical protein ACO1Q7_14325 [Gemmatimonas sp.]
MRIHQACWSAALVLSLAACKSTQGGRPTADASIINRAQILEGSYRTAYDVVQALHPNWLSRRSQRRGNADIIWVYVDNSRYGDVNSLRNVQASSINNIRRIDGGTATTRWGLGHGEGVLMIITHTPR